MALDPNNIQATMNVLARQVLGNVAAQTFAPCATPGCRAMSLGWTCADCGEVVCNSHGFATLALKPQVVCARCVAKSVPPASGGVSGGVEDAVRDAKKKRRHK